MAINKSALPVHPVDTAGQPYGPVLDSSSAPPPQFEVHFDSPRRQRHETCLGVASVHASSNIHNTVDQVSFKLLNIHQQTGV